MLTELWQKNMAAINLRITFKTAKWPENLKAANAGKLMMWGVSWVATAPDGDTFLALGGAPLHEKYTFQQTGLNALTGSRSVGLYPKIADAIACTRV